jgi:hypothetical protein
MPDIVTGSTDRDSLRKSLETFLATAKWLVKITPTQMDDQLVDVLSTLVEQDWFIDALVALLSLGGKSAVIDKLKEVLGSK